MEQAGAPLASNEKAQYMFASDEKKNAAFSGPGPQDHPALAHESDPAPPYEAAQSSQVPQTSTRSIEEQQAYSQHPTSSTSARPGVPQGIKPIAIPQICNSKGAPFVRAYAPELSDLGISEAEFIKFVDSLNEAAQGNSALGALDVTGQALRKIPIIGILGADLAHVSKFSNAQLSKKGVTAHVAQQSEELFKPRGLEVSVCTGKVLKSHIGSIGDSLLAPLDTHVTTAHQQTVWQRRMNGLSGRAADLMETTLPVANPGIAQKLKTNGTLHIMDRENDSLMRDRRGMLRGTMFGRQQDSEEKAAEEMLWLLVEPIRA